MKRNNFYLPKFYLLSVLKERVLIESFHEVGEFLSLIFVLPKPSHRSYRMIFNLKKLNESLPYTHFEMETIKSF